MQQKINKWFARVQNGRSLILVVLIFAGTISLLSFKTAVDAAATTRPGTPTADDLPEDFPFELELIGPADLYASRRAGTGTVTTSSQGIFGPHLCVEYGDPFSSIGDWRAPLFRKQWHGDADDKAYHYRIMIPPDYPHDILRVELFDPDSINQPGNTATIIHTELVLEYLPPTETKSCSGAGATQKNPCLINTGEELFFDIDLINPWWILRIDENRGSGVPPGNPTICAEPSSYTVGYNTITHYRLFYYSQAEDGSIVVNELASYYGQSGHTPRDNAHFMSYDHQTDMRWVTPGGRPSFDSPGVNVPTVCGSPNGGDFEPVYCPNGSLPGPGNGFEIEIPGDIPGIVTDTNGVRYLYLDVETVSGGSENGFEIWAGTPDHVNTVSSDVNIRNVQAINDPSVINTGGATVFGIGHLPVNSMYSEDIDVPLTYVGLEYAGTTVFVSHYDSDSGAVPPMTFYFDSIPEGDWSMAFAVHGVPDPDGKTGRCVPGGCNAQFVEPPYEVYVPKYIGDCTNSRVGECTPFPGGRLMVRYNSGVNDTFHWNVKLFGPPNEDK